MKNWKYKITTSEQLAFAEDNELKVLYTNKNTSFSGYIYREDDGEICVFNEEENHYKVIGYYSMIEQSMGLSLERNESLYLVAKTAKELKKGDECSTYAYIEGVKRVELFIPNLPKDIFPEQEKIHTR